MIGDRVVNGVDEEHGVNRVREIIDAMLRGQANESAGSGRANLRESQSLEQQLKNWDSPPPGMGAGFADHALPQDMVDYINDFNARQMHASILFSENHADAETGRTGPHLFVQHFGKLVGKYYVGSDVSSHDMSEILDEVEDTAGAYARIMRPMGSVSESGRGGRRGRANLRESFEFDEEEDGVMTSNGFKDENLGIRVPLNRILSYTPPTWIDSYHNRSATEQFKMGVAHALRDIELLDTEMVQDPNNLMSLRVDRSEEYREGYGMVIADRGEQRIEDPR